MLQKYLPTYQRSNCFGKEDLSWLNVSITNIPNSRLCLMRNEKILVPHQNSPNWDCANKERAMIKFIEAYENAFINQNRDWNQSCRKAWKDQDYKKEEELANPFFKEAAVLLRADINASLPNWGSEQKQQHLCLFIWEQCTEFVFWTLHKR